MSYESIRGCLLAPNIIWICHK